MAFMGSWAERAMIDTELLRAICKELITEKDSDKLEELLSLLCALVQSDQEEVELKLPELSKRYPSLKKRRSPQENKNGGNKKSSPSNREGI
jgi:hypothetical protein